MKKFAVWALAFVFIFALAFPQGSASANANTLDLVVDGQVVEGYEQPFLLQEEALIPVENLFSAAGFDVTKSGQTTTVTNGHLTVDFNPSARSIKVNGEKADVEFPLTLQNGGNYISTDFLSSLEGFSVEVTEDQEAVTITTNRVKDVEAFLQKMNSVELNSYSANMDIDQKMESSSEIGTIDMKMGIEMDMVQDPLGLYMLTKLVMNDGTENIDLSSEAYLTKDGFFQNEGTSDSWIKLDDSLTAGLLEASLSQADPLAQLELFNGLIEGIHIFEYDDVYVMTFTITDEEFQELIEEISSLLGGLLGTVTDEAVAEDVVEEATEETVEGTEEFESLLGDLSMKVKDFYFTTNIDKKTLFPIDLTGKLQLVMSFDGEEIITKQTMTGTYSNYNTLKEIVVPEDVLKNAKSFEDYLSELGLDEIEAE